MIIMTNSSEELSSSDTTKIGLVVLGLAVIAFFAYLVQRNSNEVRYTSRLPDTTSDTALAIEELKKRVDKIGTRLEFFESSVKQLGLNGQNDLNVNVNRTNNSDNNYVNENVGRRPFRPNIFLKHEGIKYNLTQADVDTARKNMFGML